MKQFASKNTALYCRLSRDDEMYGDSSSIQTQKIMLENYAKQNGFAKGEFYADDGFSGTSFNRPEFQRLVADIENNLVDTVIVKDLSRLGRDYLRTGIYLEDFFPEHNVRFIAIDDNVDSEKGDNEFTPFKNIINEWYAKDVSKKVKGGYRTKALQGKFTGPYAPYGYHKSLEDKHKLVVDEATAPVVKKMFELAAQGKTPYMISKVLRTEKIKRPRVRIIEELNTYHSEEIMQMPYLWTQISVRKILQNRVYAGHMVSQKSSSKSYKNRKTVHKPQESWIHVINTHEALVTEETFEVVQKELSIKRREKKNIATNIFAGRIKCADCGKSLHINFGRKFPHLSCASYKRYGIEICSMHYMNYNKLYQAVLNSIREKASQICADEKFFLLGLKKSISNNADCEKRQLEKNIVKSERRIAEINTVIKKLYEDNVLDKISDERFSIMSCEYETEQAVLTEQVIVAKKQLKSITEKDNNIHKFVKAIEKYKDLQTLDEAIVIELIDKIVVHENKLIKDKKIQQVDIYFNFIGNT